VQVHYDEGVANRIGPESCVAAREGRGEALTGEHTGQPLSLEMNIVSGADAFSIAEGYTDGRANRKCPSGPAGSREPGMCGRSLRGNREISRLAGGTLPGAGSSASGRRGAVADDERS